jgi:hypothetical protein
MSITVLFLFHVHAAPSMPAVVDSPPPADRRYTAQRHAAIEKRSAGECV